jgi:hypothetical protein
VNNSAATGFACQPLPDGTVQVEFHDDRGGTIGSQIVSVDALRHLPLLAELTLAVMGQGAVAGAGCRETGTDLIEIGLGNHCRDRWQLAWELMVSGVAHETEEGIQS